MKLMDPKDLELQNRNAKYCFLLCSCGWNSGNCRSYGEKDERLLMIRGSKGMTPLLMAALLRHSEIVWYLCKKTIDEDSTEKIFLNALNLLYICTSCLFKLS